MADTDYYKQRVSKDFFDNRHRIFDDDYFCKKQNSFSSSMEQKTNSSRFSIIQKFKQLIELSSPIAISGW